MDISLRYPVHPVKFPSETFNGVKDLYFFIGTKNIIVFTLILLVVCLLPLFWLNNELAEAKGEISVSQVSENLSSVQGNSLLALSNPNGPEPKVIKKIKMVLTAYSSSPLETDSTPFVTASNTWVKDGIVANNLLPFGTKVRIPELYGEKIFVVEDRMNWRKGYYHLDIWFPNYWQAKDFGAKNTYIEVLEG